MNSVNLLGRLTRNVETRKTQSGKTVSNFTLAVDGYRKDDPASFINCVLWDRESLLPYLVKGKQVTVSGRLQTRSYENNQGQKVFVTEVVALEVRLLGGSNSQGGNQVFKQQYQPQTKTQAPSNNPFNNNGSIDVDDSSLPF